MSEKHVFRLMDGAHDVLATRMGGGIHLRGKDDKHEIFLSSSMFQFLHVFMDCGEATKDAGKKFEVSN